MSNIKKKIAGFKKDKTGVAAVEFALIVPILLLLLVGLIDYGLYINTEMKLENMARSAADYVANGGDEENLEDDIVAFGFAPDDKNDFDDIVITTELTCECDDADVIVCDNACPDGEYKRRFIEVIMELEYDPLFLYPGLPSSMVLTGDARLQMQ